MPKHTLLVKAIVPQSIRAIAIHFFLILFPFSIWGQDLLDNVKINLEINEQTLPACLWLLSEQSNIPIAFSNNDFSNKKISASFQQKSVRFILSHFLADSKLSFTYIKGSILIKKKKIKQFTISGYVEDQKSGERLIGVNVIEPSSSNGVATNPYGFFSISVNADKPKIRVSYIGYQPLELDLQKVKTQPLIISLQANSTLQEVLVNNKELMKRDLLAQSQQNILPYDEFETSSLFAGEADIVQIIQQVAGVQKGTDGIGGLYVRGGNADQNLVLFDGVPIYHPYHAFGLFSIFDSKIIKNVKFHKGSFPARFGGRISSIVDVRTKDGNNQTFQAHASVGLISSTIALEGPLKKKKGAFFVSARRSHIDSFLKNYSKKQAKTKDEKKFYNYYFNDIIGKLNYTLDSKNRIYFSFYTGSDHLILENISIEDESIDEGPFFSIPVLKTDSFFNKWGNRLAVLRWNHQFNDKLFSNLTFTHSQYDFLSKEINKSLLDGNLGFTDQQQAQQKSNIQTLSAKIDFDYVPLNYHYIRVGLFVQKNHFAPSFIHSSFTLFNGPQGTPIHLATPRMPSFETIEVNSYFEDDWQVNSKLSINSGLYASLIFLEDAKQLLLDPRFLINFKAKKNLLFHLSINKMHQPTHVLTKSGAGIPNDLWVSATNKIKPQQAWIFDTGFKWSFLPKWTMEMQAYFKKMKHLVNFQEEKNLFQIQIADQPQSTFSWENTVTTGIGSAKGLELSIQKHKSQLSGEFNYALSYIDRQFPNINNGKTYPFRLNHRHAINMALVYKVSPKLRFLSKWSFNSGSFTNIALSEWYYSTPSFAFGPINEYGNKNNIQLPTYHRLDLSAHFDWPTPKGKFSLVLGINNVYNRKNIYLVTETLENGKTKAISLLPILPYFNFSLSL